MNIYDILRYVQRTNPEMTEDRLINELIKTPSSTVSLAFLVKK